MRCGSLKFNKTVETSWLQNLQRLVLYVPWANEDVFKSMLLAPTDNTIRAEAAIMVRSFMVAYEGVEE